MHCLALSLAAAICAGLAPCQGKPGQLLREVRQPLLYVSVRADQLRGSNQKLYSALPVARLLNAGQIQGHSIELAVLSLDRAKRWPKPVIVARVPFAAGGAADRVRAQLDGEGGKRTRTIDDEQVWALCSGLTDHALEVVVQDDGLLLSNAPASLDAIVRGTLAASESLAADPRLAELQVSPTAPGSGLFVDWTLVCRHFGLGSAQEFAGLAGLTAVDAAWITMRDCGDGHVVDLRATLHEKVFDDSLLALVRPLAVAELVRGLPDAGPSALSCGLEMAALRGCRGMVLGGLHAALQSSCRFAGLDLDRDVLARFGPVSGLGFVRAGGRLQPVFEVTGDDERFVAELVTRAAGVLNVPGPVVPMSSPYTKGKAGITARGAALVMAPTPRACEAALVRSWSETDRSERAARVADALRTLNIGQAAAVFHFDLRQLGPLVRSVDAVCGAIWFEGPGTARQARLCALFCD